MPRYIDADELWLQLDKRESFEQGRNRAYYKGLRDAKKVLDEQPTADVVERKRGQWIRSGEWTYEVYECSSCGKPWLEWWASAGDSDWMSKKLKYCPFCGADMRGEQDAETN